MPPESSQIWKIGDCLELIKEIPDDSIDMILSDMPFGITQNQWDKRINLKELWIEYYRVIKPNRAMALTSNQPFTSELIMSNLKDFRYMWIWVKNAATGHLNAHKQPMRKFEDILIFSKGKIPEYNPQELISYGKIV
ncbi:site-specific DNA-methyltransferase, partial [bacterium]|nr:site-specific DNA-methyltransferase [bacterium]